MISPFQISKSDASLDSLLNDDSAWKSASTLEIKTYWSGLAAPRHRHFTAVGLWNEYGIAIRFIAAQGEPRIVSRTPCLTEKTIGLWNRDVCELFLAPDPQNTSRYFEFELAPTGEWLDVAINYEDSERQSDWTYCSGMKVLAVNSEVESVMTATIPWTAFGQIPTAGSIWMGNLLRCVGEGPDRGYLAWMPTKTSEPNFHVPSAFGKIEFKD